MSLSIIAIAVAILSLCISIGSLLVSAYVALRDRAQLRIKSQFSAANEQGPDEIVITLTNFGRRPVILRMLGGTAQDGRWFAALLDKGGIRLGEHEQHVLEVEKGGTASFEPIGEGEPIVAEWLWIEDSLGTRHQVPNSREYVRRLWK